MEQTLFLLVVQALLRVHLLFPSVGVHMDSLVNFGGDSQIVMIAIRAAPVIILTSGRFLRTIIA
jgi:hypothetical protein